LIVSVVFVPSWLYIFLKYGSIHEWNGAYTNLLGQYVSGEEWTGPAQFIFWISTIFIGFPYVSYTMKFFRKKFDIRKLL
jgi:hypothetical protein